MKKSRFLLLITAMLVLLSSCEKEKEIIYYDNVIGEGWLAVKTWDENPNLIIMQSNKQIELTQRDRWLQGMFEWTEYEHIDVITTDENGHFTCRFVKAIKIKTRQEINCYIFRHDGTYLLRFDAEILKEAAKKGTFTEPTIIKLDTLYTVWEGN